VAQGIVESLEIVDVDHHDAQRTAASPRPAFLAPERLLEIAPVVQTGQTVVYDLVFQAIVGLGQLLFRPKALLIPDRGPLSLS